MGLPGIGAKNPAPLKPYSDVPKYRRLIRFLWYYLVSSARHMSKRELLTVTEAVKKVIGEKQMPTILEQLIDEGEVRGAAKGKMLAILEMRFNKVPQEIECTIRSMTDPIALESLVVHAKNCQSLEEFAETIR